jgi:sentrin-specific protease 7
MQSDLQYPNGDPDSITIRKQDYETLEPKQFLNDTILDFYLKYLQRQQSESRFYIFNCFFYPKLVQCKERNADFATLQKWSHGVNLFSIDYILIPINHNNHWSVVIIPHLQSLGQEDRMQSSCILHLDSLEGGHKHVERHIKTCLRKVWI